MKTHLLSAAILLAPLTVLDAADPVSVDLAARTWQGIPGLERTRGGRVFVSWFTGGPKEPAPDNTVVLSFSDDDGRTFSAPEVMALPLSDGTRCYDPCLWIDPKGRLWYLFNRSIQDSTRHGVYARICDAPDASPPVWGEEFRVGFEGPFSFRMNKPIVLSSGEWVMPVVHALEPVAGWAGFDPKQVHGAAVSTDEGKTWVLHGAVKMPGASLENMIVELRDGRLWMLIRTAKVLWESHSADRGRTWTEARPTTIATPHSRFFIRRLASGNLLLVNHYRFTGRSHLTTRPVTFSGKHLFVNLAGEVRAELLDVAGKVVAISEAVSRDSTRQLAKFPGLAAHAGQRVRLRFHIAHGSLYAFWVAPDAGSASNGYVGALGHDRRTSAAED